MGMGCMRICSSSRPRRLLKDRDKGREEVGVEEDHQAWLLGEEAEVEAEVEVEEVGVHQQLRAEVEAGAGGEAQALPE